MDTSDLELWQQARAAHPHDAINPNPPFVAALEHFAASIRAKQKEQCAAIVRAAKKRTFSDCSDSLEMAAKAIEKA